MQATVPLINFRPWRAQRRRQLTRRLLLAIIAVALIGAAVTVAAGLTLNRLIANQNQRNTYIEQQTRRLNADVTAIRELQAQRTTMLKRLRIIEALQGNRPVIVRVFDEMVRILPDDTFFSSLKVTDKTVRITGIAGTNHQVSVLMRNIEHSNWFAAPTLTNISARKEYGHQASAFALSFQLVTPGAD